jgi:alkylation response protein AidB-like acyl-CoA dehydrogenase
MNFDTAKPLQEKLDLIQSFLEKEVYQLEPLFLNHKWDELFPALEAARHKVKALKLWAPNMPASTGGTFTSLLDLALIGEILGQSPLGHFIFGCQAPDAGNAELLHLFGTDKQKEKWLKPLVSGSIRSCFAMTEPHTAGSNPTLLDAKAILIDGNWHISGRKWFTTSAEGSAFSIAMVVTNPEAHKHKRASMIIVPTATPGYDIVRNISVMGVEGKGYFSHAEVTFTNCVVPEGNIVGAPGDGFALAQERLGPGRIQHCMRWLGIGKRSIDVSKEFLNRRQITSSQVLAQQPLMQAAIAESKAELEAARLLVLKTAFNIEKHGFEASKNEVSLIKFHTANVVQRVVDRSLQSLGGLGMTDDTVLSFFYREERAARIYDGADEVHKIVAAKRFLTSK